MKIFIAFIPVLLFFSCNTNQQEQQATPPADTAKAVEKPATISAVRDSVSSKAVASFSKKVADELNDWKFSVNVYETKETFHYLMKVQYEELKVEDTLKIPNFGIEPTVEIHPGPDTYSCIIGFLDKQQKFLEYKLVTVADDGNLKIKVLHHYAVSTYSE